MPITEKRNATERTPSVVLIKPDGHFYRSPIAGNINDSVVMTVGGEHIIRPDKLKRGYVFLVDGADSKEQAEAIQRYLDQEIEEGNLERLPDEFLPKICKERRVASAKAKAVDWAKLGFHKPKSKDRDAARAG